MYFYRLMSRKELQDKEIHNNTKYYEDCINTHKYDKNKKYVHLFLNAESCFEDFESILSDDMIVAQFDIPDEVVFKYGIGLGCYNPLYNSYTLKYRQHFTFYFWLPEIAIEADDFNYDWCTKVSPIRDKRGEFYLPIDFRTDDNEYKEIINDGYLIGYNSEFDLLEKYKDMLSQMKYEQDKNKFIKRLNTFKK